MVTDVKRDGKGFSYLKDGVVETTDSQKAFKDFDITIAKTEASIKEEELKAEGIIAVISESKDKAIKDFLAATPTAKTDSPEVVAIREQYDAEIRDTEVTRDNTIYTIDSKLKTYKSDIEKTPDGALYLYIKDGGKISDEIPDETKIKEKLSVDKDRFVSNSYSKDEQTSDITSEIFNRNKTIAIVQEAVVAGTSTADGLDGYVNLESEVMTTVASIESGVAYTDAMASVPAVINKYYGELVKINLKASWAESCKDELERAVTAGETPSYPTFPTI